MVGRESKTEPDAVRRSRLGVVAVVGVPLAVAVVLHRMGAQPWLRVDWSDLGSWLSSTPVEDALAAIARLLALAIAYWLSISTGLYALARLTGRKGAVAHLARFTLPGLRRLADRAIVGAVAAATLAVPVTAVPDDTPEVPDNVVSLPFEALRPDEGRPDAAAPIALPIDPLEGLVVERSDDDSITIIADATLQVVVHPGDHLWNLAERRLATALGRPASDHEIAPYWVEVINANRDRLTSGDPDLVYPGEVIVLPPVVH